MQFGLVWLRGLGIKNDVNQAIFEWRPNPQNEGKQLNLNILLLVFYCQPMKTQQITCYKKIWTKKTVVSSLTFLRRSVLLFSNKRFSPYPVDCGFI